MSMITIYGGEEKDSTPETPWRWLHLNPHYIEEVNDVYSTTAKKSVAEMVMHRGNRWYVDGSSIQISNMLDQYR